MTRSPIRATSRRPALRCISTGPRRDRPKALSDLEDVRASDLQPGVDVSGEVGGIAQDPANTPWQPIDLADRAFGQSVAVTQLQLANGYATMVNGGYHVQPHVARVDRDGTQRADARTAARHHATLADELKGVLEHVTSSVPWYAEGSLIPGFQIGGKTGTAQIWDASEQQVHEEPLQLQLRRLRGGDAPRAVVAVRIGPARPQGQCAGRPRADHHARTSSFTGSRRTRSPGWTCPRRPTRTRAAPEPGSAAQASLEPGAYAKWLHSGGTGGSTGGPPSPAARRWQPARPAVTSSPEAINSPVGINRQREAVRGSRAAAVDVPRARIRRNRDQPAERLAGVGATRF